MASLDRSLPAADLVGEIVRIFKVRRLYGAAHPKRIEVEAGAASHIQALLESGGPVELTISENALSVGEESVYEQPPGPESLAFLLFREGLRGIVFYPGLEPWELACLLDHVAASATTAGAESDLVARLWQERIVHIRYTFVENLADEEWVPPPARDVPEAALERPPIQLVREDAETLQDPRALADGDSTLYALEDEDLEALRAQLDEEKKRSLLEECLTCIRELLIDPVHDDLSPLIGALGEIQTTLLDQGGFEPVRAMHALFDPCLERAPAGSPLQQGFATLRRAALDAVALQRLVAGLESAVVDEAEAAAYCRAFGPHDLRVLLAGVPDLKRICQRPVLADAFLAIAAGNLPALSAAILATEPDIACGATHLAGLVADPSLIEPLGAALQAEDDRIRIEALLALKSFADERAGDCVAAVIDDRDPAIRLYALRHLIARRHVAALPRVAALLDGQPHPAEGRERRLLYETYGALGGANVVAGLAARLKRRGKLFRKVDPEEAACVLVGLAATRTEAAHAILRRSAASRDPLIRRVAQQAMTGWTEHAGAPV